VKMSCKGITVNIGLLVLYNVLFPSRYYELTKVKIINRFRYNVSQEMEHRKVLVFQDSFFTHFSEYTTKSETLCGLVCQPFLYSHTQRLG
jgi:hypothetical protein